MRDPDPEELKCNGKEKSSIKRKRRATLFSFALMASQVKTTQSRKED